MAETDVAESIKRIRRKLRSAFRWELLSLASALNNSEATVAFNEALPAQLRIGSELSIDTETMRVTALNQSANSVTVIRGWEDSTAEAHAASTPVYVNPRFSGHDILDEMIYEVRSWPTDVLFRVISSESSVEDTTELIELPASMETITHLVGFRYRDDRKVAWPRLNGRLENSPKGSWSAAPTSGKLFRSFNRLAAGDIVIFGAAPFDSSTITTSNNWITHVGLTEGMIEVVELGVRARLLDDADSNSGQRIAVDEAVDRDEVPPGTNQQLARQLRRMRDRRMREESAKLRAVWPVMAS